MKYIRIVSAVIFLAAIFTNIEYSYGDGARTGREIQSFTGDASRDFSTKSDIADKDAAADKDLYEITPAKEISDATNTTDMESWSLLFVLLLATFIGLGVILRVSRLLHTPLMSLTNAISAIAVIGSITVTGEDYPLGIRIMGAIALFASMTNIVSGFLITDRMLKMFKQKPREGKS